MTQLNATAASLLGFLHWAPMTGWDLVRTAEVTIGDFWSLTPSQVYRELQRLAADGLVEVGEPGPRDRRPHTVTPAGKAAFREWLSREPVAETIRFPLLLAVLFGAEAPDGVLGSSIAAHRRAHVERLAGYEQQRQAALAASDTSPYALATLDFGIRYERAVLDWFDHLPKQIKNG